MNDSLAASSDWGVKMEHEEQYREVRNRSEPTGRAPETSEQTSVSVIGASITITGDIDSDEDLIIEGTVEGSVQCGTLVVGEKGCVRGEIHTERLRLAGTVEGSIETKDLAIETSARVKGDISYARLRVASGGTIHGHMICLGETAPEEHPQKKPNAAPANGSVAVFEDPSFRASREAMRNAAA